MTSRVPYDYDRMYSSLASNQLGGYLSRVNKIQCDTYDRNARYLRSYNHQDECATHSRGLIPYDLKELATDSRVAPFVYERVPSVVVTKRTAIYRPDCSSHTLMPRYEPNCCSICCNFSKCYCNLPSRSNCMGRSASHHDILYRDYEPLSHSYKCADSCRSRYCELGVGNRVYNTFTGEREYNHPYYAPRHRSQEPPKAETEPKKMSEKSTQMEDKDLTHNVSMKDESILATPAKITKYTDLHALSGSSTPLKSVQTQASSKFISDSKFNFNPEGMTETKKIAEEAESTLNEPNLDSDKESSESMRMDDCQMSKFKPKHRGVELEIIEPPKDIEISYSVSKTKPTTELIEAHIMAPQEKVEVPLDLNMEKSKKKPKRAKRPKSAFSSRVNKNTQSVLKLKLGNRNRLDLLRDYMKDHHCTDKHPGYFEEFNQKVRAMRIRENHAMSKLKGSKSKNGKKGKKNFWQTFEELQYLKRKKTPRRMHYEKSTVASIAKIV